MVQREEESVRRSPLAPPRTTGGAARWVWALIVIGALVIGAVAVRVAKGVGEVVNHSPNEAGFAAEWDASSEDEHDAMCESASWSEADIRDAANDIYADLKDDVVYRNWTARDFVLLTHWVGENRC